MSPQKTLPIIFISLMCLILPLFTACGNQNGETAANTAELSLDDYNGKRIGAMEGTVQEVMVAERLPKAKVSLYNSDPDLAQALDSGALDAISVNDLIAKEVKKNKPHFVALEEPLGSVDVAFVYPKTEQGKKLRDQMNEFMASTRADGTFDEMISLWFENDGEAYVDFSGLPSDGPVLNFATTGASPPFSYYHNDEVYGFDIDFTVRFCKEYGYGLNIDTMVFSSIIPALSSGKYDLAGNGVFITEERKKSVYFSDIYYGSDILLMVNQADSGLAAGSFLASLKDSFTGTFIQEDRWQLIFKGIGTTIFISLFATVFGTLLGFGLCILRMGKQPFLHGFTTVYIRILQGTPLVVLLMILFYLIFARTGISGEWVAVIAFALNFAAYTCEIFRSGFESIPKGQTEAALATGYTNRQAFIRIVMPQAIRKILPVYKGEFISLVKMTSIVGYIAVQDLTKMSDIIRARTYEAFFPLIITAVIYFIITWLLTLVLRSIEIKLEPKRKNRTVKGVKMQ